MARLNGAAGPGANAADAQVDARFEAAGFGELSAWVGAGFDALLCLGNSLPHLLTPADLSAASASTHPDPPAQKRPP